MPVKKNCHNCKFLEWIDADRDEDSGFCCNKRDYTSEQQESAHLNLLDREDYRIKGKKCHSAPTPNAAISGGGTPSD